jgi:hypothetical protein
MPVLFAFIFGTGASHPSALHGFFLYMFKPRGAPRAHRPPAETRMVYILSENEKTKSEKTKSEKTKSEKTKSEMKLSVSIV